MVGGVGSICGLVGDGCCAEVEGRGGLVCVCEGAVWAKGGGDGDVGLVWVCVWGLGEDGGGGMV